MCFINKMDRIGADFFARPRVDQGPPRRQRRRHPAADRRRGQLQGRRRPRQMRRSSGTTRSSAPSGTSRRSPPTCRRRPTSTAHELIDVLVELRREHPREVPRARRRSPPTTSGAPSARAPSPARSSRSSTARPSRTRACSRCSTPSSTTSPARVDLPPTKGMNVKGDEELERKAVRQRALRGARLQDHDRPPRRQAHLLPRLLRHPREGRHGRQHHPRQQGAHRPHPRRCTPTAARTSTPCSPATSWPASASRTPAPATPSPTPGTEIVLENLEFPEPVIHVAVEPKTKVDQDKMGKALFSLSEEDPTFQVRTDEETGQTVISGMGELHLEVIVDRMLREFNVDATVGKPQVAYRETITQTVDQGHLHPQEADRWLGPVRRGHHRPRAHRPRRRLRVRRQDHRRPRPQGVHPVGRRRHPAVARRGRARRLPHGRRPGRPHRRQVPRRRLLGDGVQDRRLDGLQGGRSARPSRCCSSRSCRSRSSRPRSTWATSSATSTPAAARSAAWTSAATARSSGPRCRCRRCSATLPTCVRAPRVGPRYTMQFDSYQQTPASVQEEIVARVRGE